MTRRTPSRLAPPAHPPAPGRPRPAPRRCGTRVPGPCPATCRQAAFARHEAAVGEVFTQAGGPGIGAAVDGRGAAFTVERKPGIGIGRTAATTIALNGGRRRVGRRAGTVRTQSRPLAGRRSCPQAARRWPSEQNACRQRRGSRQPPAGAGRSAHSEHGRRTGRSFRTGGLRAASPPRSRSPRPAARLRSRPE